MEQQWNGNGTKRCVFGTKRLIFANSIQNHILKPQNLIMIELFKTCYMEHKWNCKNHNINNLTC